MQYIMFKGYILFGIALVNLFEKAKKKNIKTLICYNN